MRGMHSESQKGPGRKVSHIKQTEEAGSELCYRYAETQRTAVDDKLGSDTGTRQMTRKRWNVKRIINFL